MTLREPQGHPERGRGVSARGFSLVELLVATVVCGLIAAAVASAVVPARAAFDATPAVIDLQQRSRTGVDVIATAIRSAETLPAVILLSPLRDSSDAEFESVHVLASVAHAARGALQLDQPGRLGHLTLAGEGCPAVDDVCGFTPGAVAAISDGSGRFDVFTVGATDSAQRILMPVAALSSAYGAGATIVEVEPQLLRLDEQADGSRSLVRDTAGGATQPIVDHVGGLGIAAWGGGDPLRRLRHSDLTDGPWLPGGPAGTYDADLLTVRRLDFWFRVEVSSALLRGPAGRLFQRAGTAGTALRWVPDRTLHASITLRKMP